MKHWAENLGVGPWFFMEGIHCKDFLYRGQPSEVTLDIALANSGGLQIELIQLLNDAPSAYKDFLDAGHEGLHHMSSWPENYDEVLETYLKNGGEVYHQGRIGSTRFVYLYTETHPGTVFELADPGERAEEMFATVREAAVSWDGSDPIRAL
jgi:hypothetical protein